MSRHIINEQAFFNEIDSLRESNRLMRNAIYKALLLLAQDDIDTAMDELRPFVPDNQTFGPWGM